MTSPLPGPHLGDDTAALVDGELSHVGRERAFAHLAGCQACRTEVEGQRRLKATLSALSTGPAPSEEFVARLLGLPAQLAALEAIGSTQLVGPVDRRVNRVRPYRRVGRRTRYVAGSVSALVASLAAVLALGGEGQESGVPVRPPVTGFVQQHAVTTGEVPFTDPAVAAVTAAFSR